MASRRFHGLVLALGGLGLITGSALPWTVLHPVATTGFGYAFGFLTVVAGAIALARAVQLLVPKLRPPSARSLTSIAALGLLSTLAAGYVALATRAFDPGIYESLRSTGPKVGNGAYVVIASGILIAGGASSARFTRRSKPR